MKKYIYAIAFLPMLGLWACSADEGTMPGTDKELSGDSIYLRSDRSGVESG